MNIIKNAFTQLKKTFTTTKYGLLQFSIILLVALLFIRLPQNLLNDWDLNTNNYWTDIPNTYLNNPNLVYPPWGLILLFPYYLLHTEGARALSVITIGWLAYNRKWSIAVFFLVVLSPYFLVTMTQSNMDILVIVLPILVWKYSQGKKWETIARGLSLSVLLLKPQCTILLILYLLWTNRAKWKKELIEIGIVGLIIIPISLFGTPPLVLQWLNNITHPSPQNQFYWSVNNVSLSARYSFWIALGTLVLILSILFLIKKRGMITWKLDQTISSLLLGSMFLLPYTSQQSLSAGLAFIPSWPGYIQQLLVLGVSLVLPSFHDNISFWTLLMAFFSLVFFCFSQTSKDGQPRTMDNNTSSS